jgi:hypothetical protein
MADIGLKFCGGCNPLIDRARLAAEIEKLLGPGDKLVRVPAPDTLETAILICGCETACAGGPKITGPQGPARKWVMVGGPCVDLEQVPEREMARVIVEKLKALRGG